MAGRQKKQINIEIGGRIRALREAAGVSREQFAEAVGLSPRFCAAVEIGLAGLSFESLKRICEYFGVNADSIIFGERMEPAESLRALLADVPAELLPEMAEAIRAQVRLINAARGIQK